MPIQLRGGLIIHNLGTIKWDNPNYHSKRFYYQIFQYIKDFFHRYIWPVGFKSSRIYFSMTTLDRRY